MMSHEACYYGTEPLPQPPKLPLSKHTCATVVVLSMCAVTIVASAMSEPAALWARPIPASQTHTPATATSRLAPAFLQGRVGVGAEPIPLQTFAGSEFMEAARTNTDGFDAQDQIEGNPNMGSLWGVPSLLVVPMALAWLYKRWAAMRQPQGAQHFFSPDAHCTVDVSALESPAVSMATVTGERTQQYVLSMDDLVSLCKRRGFVYQASDLYGGFAGFWDYGPLGVELKNQIKAKWWKKMVQLRDDVVGIDSAIIGSPKVWEASGHLAGFSDPMVDCKESNQRFRADQVLYSAVLDAEGKQCGYVSCQQDEVSNEKALAKKAKKLVKEAGGKGPHQPLNFKELIDCPVELIDQIPSPATGNPGTLTPPRDFNLMFSTNVGPVVADSSTAFLRPETAQGIFTNFKNVMDTSRVSLPFGIAQIGKAFRNEITPRNFIFRSREFEQMEIEYFIKEDDWERCHQEWLDTMHKFLMETCGLRPELVGTEVHAQDKLAHYARACTDLTFHFPFGEQELLGVAARGCYDLTQHANASGRKLEVNDQQTKTKFIPHVIEPSLGVDRLFLAVLCSAYDEDEIGGEKRTVLRFSPEIAPVKVLVLPLVKNNEDIMGRAKDLFERLRMRWNCTMDITGAIGRRYRRGDEAGVPFCVTVDFDSLEDGTVTVRDRDSTEQKRVSEDELIAELTKAIDGY